MSRRKIPYITIALLTLFILVSGCFLFAASVAIRGLESGHGIGMMLRSGRADSTKFGPQWTPSGDRVVFAFNGTIYSLDMQGRGLQTVYHPDDKKHPSTALSPQISSSGERVLFSVFESEDCLLDFMCNNLPYWSIVTTNIDGSNKTFLKTTRAGATGSAVWSPDGTRIAFMSDFPAFDAGSYDGSGPNFSLFTMNADGMGETNMTPSIQRAAPKAPAWSPDGQHIAFWVHHGEGRHILTVLNLQDSSLTELGEIHVGPTWSPDGRRLAFARHEGEVTSLHTVQPNGSNLTTIHQRVSRSEGGKDVPLIGGLHWSPDGTKILMSDYIVLSVVDADGSDFSVLVYEDHAQYVGAYPSWSRDGSMIAFHDPDAWVQDDNVIVLMRADGSEKRSLVKFVDDGNHKWHLESVNENLRTIQGSPRPLRFTEPSPTPLPSA